VYVTGISNGGLMSYRIACDAADIFAAAAPVAANMSTDIAPGCKPARPISVAIMNGTEDPIMPWGGGPVKVLWFKRGNVLSTSATQARWVELDHCGAAQTDATVDAANDDGTALVKHTSHCIGMTEVDLFEIRGGGHTWPMGEPYLGERLVGRVSHELDANEAIWEFFARHRG
jgi:polyhydroxybutyrate depolymerase